MMINALIPVKTSSWPQSVDSSELKIVRITDRQFTLCDIYLDLKQLIKPIFTFTGKHASWYGGKGVWWNWRWDT